MTQRTFFGRKRERAELLSAWETARQGRLVMALVNGEAGIGKTALLQNTIDAVRADGAAAFSIDTSTRDDFHAVAARLGRALREEYGDDLWSALADTTRERLDRAIDQGEDGRKAEQEEGAADAPSPRDLAEAVACAAAVRSLVLLLDATNHAGRELRELLQTLVTRHRTAPLLLLGAYRSHEVQPSGDFAGLLTELDDAGDLRSVELRGFGIAEARGLLDELTERPVPNPLAREVMTETGGNPLYMAEIGNTLRSAEIPDGSTPIARIPGVVRRLAGVVAPRFMRLSETSRQILIRVAILGDSVSAREVHLANPETETDELDRFFQESMREGFLVETSSPDRELRAEIVQPIVRDALAGMISPVQRSRIAMEMAGRIEATRSGAASSAILARLYCQSVSPDGLDTCRSHSLRAGHLAIQQQRWAEAVEHFERYIANTGEAADPSDLGNVLLELSRALFQTNRHRAGRKRLTEAFESFAAAGDSDGVVALVTSPMYSFGHRENMVDLLERARALVPQDHPGWGWVSLRYAISLHDDDGDYSRSLEVCREVLNDEQIRTTPPVACRCAAVAAVNATRLRDSELARDMAEECRRYAENDPTLAVWQEYALEYVLRGEGRLEEAEEALHRALVHAYRFREQRYRWPALLRASDYAFRRGDFGNAVARAGEGLALEAYAELHLRDRGSISLLTGKLDQFQEDLNELERRTAPESPWPDTARVALVGLLTLGSRFHPVAAQRSELGARADRLLEEEIETLGNPYFAFRYAASAGYRAFVTGDDLQGGESYRRLRSLDTYWLVSEEYRLHRLAVSASAAGRRDEAEELFEAAQTQAAEGRNEPARALILFDHAEHRARSEGNDSAAARDLFRRARQAAGELGMRLFDEDAGGRGSFRGLLPGITDRELEVLKVVARGSTNQQIADTLGISTNTVAFHVRSIMEKLGLANRAQAVAFSWKNGIITAADLDPNFPAVSKN